MHRQAGTDFLGHAADSHRDELTKRFADFQFLVLSGSDLEKPANTLAAVKHRAGEKGFTPRVTPVRPTCKREYSLTPFEEYVNWK
ncbi:MAG: hypothetical protein GY697_27390 [Desulfobacterales bacterium]|nr:hypothetical protein [Desulfobacterales bacterium]